MTVSVTTTSVTSGGVVQSNWGNEVFNDLTNIAAAVNGVTPITQGGTGQITAAAAYAALFPGTTKGDFVVYSGTQPTRLPIGNANQLPVANPAFPNGLGYATLDEPNELVNVGFSVAMASNNLTVTLTDKFGNTLTSTNQALISFRDATLTNGRNSLAAVTSAISITAPQGATFGQTVNNVPVYTCVFAILNGSTVELALAACCSDDIRETALWTTVAISASATTAWSSGVPVIYSNTQRTNVPVRYLGCFLSQQATAGTWVTAPTEVCVGQQLIPRTAFGVYNSATQQTAAGGAETVTLNFDTREYDRLSEFDTSAHVFTSKMAGIYKLVNYNYRNTNVVDGDNCWATLYVNGAQARNFGSQRVGSGGDVGFVGVCEVRANPGDGWSLRPATSNASSQTLGFGGGYLSCRWTGSRMS